MIEEKTGRGHCKERKSSVSLPFPPMKIALAADWLTTNGGAEQVLSEFHALYPDAPFFTTVAKKGSIRPLADADIRTSALQRWYNMVRNHQLLLAFMPSAMESLDVRGYDVILSSSHAVGKGIVPESGTLHVCYCHTPMRYAWEMEDEYLRDFHIPAFLQPAIKRRLEKLRQWDLTTARRTDLFIANSETSQERIKRIYGRESIVIPPPVKNRFLESPLRTDAPKDPYFLAVGRFVPYKRFDLLIEVANERKLPLKIVGRGQDDRRLRRLAGPTVEFLGYVPDGDLPSLYANAEALLFPQYEDAGIVQLEAQACGTPVIAYDAGGAKTLTREGVTSILFPEQTKESLMRALDQFTTKTWDRAAIKDFARAFSQDAFREKIKTTVAKAYDDFKNGKRDRFFS